MKRKSKFDPFAPVLAGTLTAALLLAGCASSSGSGTTATGSTESSSASDTESTSDDHLARIKSTGKITVGLEGDWQPFSYHDDDDNLVGYDVEVAQNIALHLGVEADLVEGPWDGLFAGMDSGRYDIVVNGVDVTPDRQQKYDFSDPYAYDHTVLIVRDDNTDITSFEDLDGKTTANSIGSTYQEIGEQYGATVSGVDTLVETLQMVQNGQVDATLNAATSFGDYMKTNPNAPLKIAATSEEATSYAIPMEKGDDNATLLAAVNNALSAMREDGTLASLSEKYFGADLTENASDSQ
ncbi:MAG: transporter substrate-binding domain-containing protein [Lachnospiraceae bacterium]|jgi:cystine transport system substrate-binding protein|nr:transporter substrate-binding domain-containing protein [Lachnospiraceae bacterium]MCI1424948.1 transporter substrate-binding domain-containing protein [Lachnospiraceae bacterium]MCI1453631.1 transporter substrate-binding domain-containing protein [Lachnospiraceae bacterium]